nr:ABC transporter permease [Bacillus pumilus]
MTASIEEDEREIGILKVLGIPLTRIKQLYVGKYAVLACVGCIAGYGLTLLFGDLFTTNIQRYMGNQPSFTSWFIPLCVSIVIAMIVISCGLCCPKKVWPSISRSSTSRRRHFNE